MPQYVGERGGTTETTKKKKPQEQQQQTPSGATSYGPSTPSPTRDNYSSVTTVDSSSKGTLPTHVVLHLAGLGQNDRELARLGRVFARRWAVSPLYIWGTNDPKAYVSPVTGQPLTMKEARVFSNNFGAVPIASMLKNVTTYTEGSGYKTARGQQPVNKVELDANTVGKFARILSSHGPDLKLEEGVGMAVQLTKLGLNPGRFAQNMEWVNAWYANSGTDDPKSAMNTAIYITQSGKRVGSIADVQDAIAPGARQATERAHAAAQAVADQYGADSPQAKQAYQNWVDAATRRGEGAIPVPTEGMTVGTDYWDQVNKEADRIALDQSAFENSFFNKFVIKPVGSVMHVMNTGYQDFWSGAVVIARVPVAAVAAGGAAIYDPQGDTPAENWDAVMAAGRYQAQRLFNQTETPGSLIAEPLGDKYQHWVGPALDFAIGWELDPLVLAGKARQAYTAERLLPGILDHGTDLNRILKGSEGAGDLSNFTRAVDKFATSKISRRMFEGDTYTMNRTIWRLRGRVEARGTLDLPFMKALKDKVDQAIAEGMPREQAFGEWQDGIRAHFMGAAPEGSIAAKVVDARLNEGFRSQQVADNIKPGSWDQPELFYQHNGLWVSETDHQALMADALNAVDEGRQTTALPGWLSVEVPGTTRLSEYGPRRIVRSAITSERVTSTRVGKRLAALPNMNPGRILNFNDAPEQYVYEHSTRWSVFTESENRINESKMAEILNSGSGVEARAEKLINDINDEAFTRITRNYGLSDDELTKLKNTIFEPQISANNKFRQQTFGAVGGKGIDTPMLESQLRNQMFVMDPVVARQGVRHYISMRDRLYSSYERIVKGHAPELHGQYANLDRTHRAALFAQSTGSHLFDAWLRFWKSLTVARPAYVSRVVLGDENLRFLATTQSMQDRLLSIAWGHRASEDPNAVKSWLDNAFDSEMKVGDDIIPIKRAGAYEYEAAAAGQVRQADLITEMMKGRDKFAKAMKSDGQWELMVPTKANEEQHLAAWSHDLTKQARQSEPGSIALQSVAEGKSVTQTRDALIQWAKKDNYTTLRTRIGIEREGVTDWADKLSKMIHGYTANDAKLAKLALEGDPRKLEQAMRLLIEDPAKRPIIHSPSLVEATDGGIWTQGTNKLYDWFVRQPEDALNRQPFYSVWKRRSEAAMYSALGQHAPALEGGVYRKVDVFHVPGREGRTLPDLDLPEGQLPRPTVGDSGGYVYHLSPPENFDSIRTGGLQPKESFFGIDPNNIPPEMKGGRLFFADSLDRAKALAHRAGDQVAFRVKASAVGETVPERLFSGSQFGRKAVPANAIEFMAADGTWHAVSEGGKFIKPALSRLVDNASRDFALGQVRRIMFDFTKQSRFTELLQFVFPFPQPFFEGFQAWGHIAYRNPTALVHGKQLFDLGVSTGFFKKDPTSGEYMVPAGIYRKPLIWASTLFGGDGTLMNKMDSPWIPLSSMNMLTSSTIKFGAEGPIGAAIGGVPIPVPGMHPPLQAFLQYANRNTTSPLAQGYLFQYGPSTTIFPRPVIAAAAAAGLDLSFGASDSSTKSLALTLTEAMHRTGMDRDENGNLIPLNEQERQAMEAAKVPVGGDGRTLEEIANEQAKALMTSRGLVALFSPGPLRTAFDGQRADYAAWQSTLDANGGDYSKALDQWYKDNASDPSKWFVPAGRTLAGEGYGEGNTAVRIPPSELVYQMFRMDGIGDLMRANKQWAALMLIGTDPNVQSEQNFMAFSDLVASGDLRYKTPAEYYQAGVDGPGWAAWNEWKQAHHAVLENLSEKYGSIDSARGHADYQEQYAQPMRDFFNQMYTTNPHWVISNLAYDDQTKSWDWANGYEDTRLQVQSARADLQHLVEAPQLSGFPGVMAMRDYMEKTDKLKERMKSGFISDINSSRAVEDGLFAKYAKIAEDTVAAQPDTQQFLSKYFNVSFDDNGKVTSTGDLVFNASETETRWASIPEDQRQTFAKFDRQLYKFQNQARENPMTSYERSKFYAEADNVMNQMWRTDPKIVKDWWRFKSGSDQQSYKEYAATGDVAFWSPFDFHQLAGINLTKRAQGYMQEISDARMEITKRKFQDPTYSSSPGYDAIDAWVRQKLSVKNPDKSFVAAVDAMNTPGYGIDHVLGWGQVPKGVDKPYSKEAQSTFKSKADWLWAKYLHTVRAATDALAAGGYTGRNYGSDSERKIYASVQDQAAKIATHYRKEDAAFDEQWRTLTEQNGEALVGSMFFPDDFFGYVGGK